MHRRAMLEVGTLPPKKPMPAKKTTTQVPRSGLPRPRAERLGLAAAVGAVDAGSFRRLAGPR